MDELLVTGRSLKNVDGIPHVVWNGYGLHCRPRCKDRMGYSIEVQKTENPEKYQSSRPIEGADGYILLPNIMIPNIYSAQALLLACEQFDLPLTSTWISGAQIREDKIPVSDFVSVDEMHEALGITKSTRTMQERTAGAIKKWCYTSDVSSAIPVRDIVNMAQDLKAFITMLLFSIGNSCTPEKLVENVPDRLAMFNPGCKSYGACIQSIPHWKLPGSIDDIERYYDNNILPIIKSAGVPGAISSTELETLRSFCNRLISAFMYRLSPALDFEGFFAAGEHASLGGAYAFWAQEALNGKAAVCKQCGKLFLRKRRDAQTCSPSCRQGWHDSRKS